jgi:hypothetical protein
MTDSELLAAQHRVIVNMGGCTCNLEWKHAQASQKCPRCQIIAAYFDHRASAAVCSHGVSLGYECWSCPRGVAQVVV